MQYKRYYNMYCVHNWEGAWRAGPCTTMLIHGTVVIYCTYICVCAHALCVCRNVTQQTATCMGIHWEHVCMQCSSTTDALHMNKLLVPLAALQQATTYVPLTSK